jgi:hypothetical protein
MITVSFDDKQFLQEINNVLQYSTGFINGIESAKPVMMKNISYKIKEILYSYIDSMARLEPQKLHHVYEWSQVGSKTARLYDIKCVSNKNNISFFYTMNQSKAIRSGSNIPFYNKAEIMENGTPIKIVAKKSDVLTFEENGETVFTKKPIDVEFPGGKNVKDGLSETVKSFFNSYLSQTLLDVTGIKSQIKDLSSFKNNLSSAKKGGYQLGVSVGERWISKVGTIE